jgi:hypothetical protein
VSKYALILPEAIYVQTHIILAKRTVQLEFQAYDHFTSLVVTYPKSQLKRYQGYVCIVFNFCFRKTSVVGFAC